MERIITILVIASSSKIVRGSAIHNAINLRVNPIFVKEESPVTAAGAFAKIPHARPPDYRQDFFTKTYIPNIAKLGVSYTNQIAKVLFNKPLNTSYAKERHEQFLKIPIISQPFSDYKIIVATAPWNMRISGSETKPAVIYFVFPEDDDEPTSMNIPEIYFVKKGDEPKHLHRKDKIEPLIIVDSNRTVTGFNSKAVSKFIKFKNKLNQ